MPVPFVFVFVGSSRRLGLGRHFGRGVGLPRFTIATARVGAGSASDVLLHLRCDADATHEYIVRSTDKLQTFKA